MDDLWEYDNSSMDIINWNVTNSTFPFGIMERNLWCIVLVLFPTTCIFGNVLVVLAVLSERSLQTSTNFLLVSLACADLLVATLVMPFSIYLTINRLQWYLPEPVCNFFCVVDVSASTSSIVHLVAISVDRFYAVVRHMEYKSPKHKRRVYSTIVFSWAFSIGIGFPLGIGLNEGSKEENECGIINPDYMLYSSVFAFYIPCLVMIIMYSFVFYKLHRRMKAIKLQEMAAGQMVQFGDNLSNILQHAYGNKENLRQASMIWALPFLKTLEETMADNEDMSTEEWDELTTILHTLESDSQQHARESAMLEPMEEIPESPENSDYTKTPDSVANHLLQMNTRRDRRTSRLMTMLYAVGGDGVKGRRRKRQMKIGLANTDSKTKANRSTSEILVRIIGGGTETSPKETANSDTESMADSDGSPGRERSMSETERRRQRSMYAAKKKIRNLKERAIELLMKLKSKQGMVIRKEARATKLVATVMLVFLLCWTPFFTLNIIKVSRLRAETWNYELESLFIFFTWLGYLNSCLNPIIYSLFNRKFRATFQRLLHWRDDMETQLNRHRHLFTKPFAGDPPVRKRTWFMLSQRNSYSPRKSGPQDPPRLLSTAAAARNGPALAARSLSQPQTRSITVSSGQTDSADIRQRKITLATDRIPEISTPLERAESLQPTPTCDLIKTDHTAGEIMNMGKEEKTGDERVSNGTERDLLMKIQSKGYTEPHTDSFTEPVEV